LNIFVCLTKNDHPISETGWWTEFYTKARPPGNKTFKESLDKFDIVMMAYYLFNRKLMC